MSARRVLKWDLAVDDQAHTIGAGRVVLVACQDDPTSVQVWTDEPTTDTRQRTARVYGTGQPVPDGAVHIGSVLAGRGLVWHVFASPFIDGTAEKAGDL